MVFKVSVRDLDTRCMGWRVCTNIRNLFFKIIITFFHNVRFYSHECMAFTFIFLFSMWPKYSSWKQGRLKWKKPTSRRLFPVLMSHPGPLSGAARWLWSWHRKQSFPLVKQFPHGPRMFSGSRVSLAEDVFAGRQKTKYTTDTGWWVQHVLC